MILTLPNTPIESTTHMSSSTISDLIDDATIPVTELLDNPPTVHTTLIPLISWIHQLVHALCAMINVMVMALEQRVYDLEQATSLSSSGSSTASGPTIATTAPSIEECTTTTMPSQPFRCSLCHARGHIVSECRTINPSAMRKRIAHNSQMTKKAQYTRMTTTYN